MVDLSNLNNEQKEAVTKTEGYIRVIASPGSGKTRALTHRFAYLIDDKSISSNNILCITYTNKAANEMKERIIKLVNNENESFENISTIHSYCDRFLRKYINLLNGNIKNNYIIYDDYDSSKIIKKVIASYPDLKDKKSSEINSLISQVKNENTNYIRYMFGLLDSFSFGEEWIDEIVTICKNNNGLMFDDLIYGALYILENYQDIRDLEQTKYKYIMVDEFQDTTPNTYKLVKLLADKNKNLFIVGDPDQSIYEFIGANPNILLKEFVEDFPETITLLMNTNYRSTNQVIELSNQLIKNNQNRHKQKNTISYQNKDGSNVVYTHFIDKANQYYNICRIIEHLHTTLKYDYKDIFVISRNNFSFPDLKKELIKNNIPYINSRTTSKLSSREEIKLLTYYLTFAINQSAFSLYNINEIADLGIEKSEMDKVLNVNIDPIQFLKEHTNDKIVAFLKSNERIQNVILSGNKKTSEILEMIVGEFGILSQYKVDLNTGYFAEGEHIASLIQNVVYSEKINPNYSIYDFIDNVALDSAVESGMEEEGVKLLTAHGSKGLEAKNVIIFDYQTIPHGGLSEEERRLSYVAFTRAKENLFILSTKTRYRSGESQFANEFKNLCIGVDEYFENMKLTIPTCDINESLSDLNDEKKEAFKTLCSGSNVFLTGEAGTGKTYLINKYLEYLRKTNKNVLICAPTGIAAANYTGGKTINKAFSISIVPSIISPNTEPSRANITNTDTIIIDEISMCRIDVFTYIMKVIEKCNNYRETPIQVILCGDFFQLPPVVTNAEKKILKQIYPTFKEGFAFESEEWEKGKFVNICLREIYRQKNNEFIEALNNARRGISIDEAIEYINNNCSNVPIENAMEIHSRNSMVDQINASALNKLETKEYIYKATYSGVISGTTTVEDELRLKPGCRVMMLANHQDLKYQNGSFATVITCGEDYIDVLTDKEKNVIRIIKRDFGFVDEPVLTSEGVIVQNEIGCVNQLPVKLAYAITIHKSQGQTYDKVNLDPEGWENGQLYVALSRIKSLQGLYLYKHINKSSLKTSENVSEFYDFNLLTNNKN